MFSQMCGVLLLKASSIREFCSSTFLSGFPVTFWAPVLNLQASLSLETPRKAWFWPRKGAVPPMEQLGCNGCFAPGAWANMGLMFLGYLGVSGYLFLWALKGSHSIFSGECGLKKTHQHGARLGVDQRRRWPRLSLGASQGHVRRAKRRGPKLSFFFFLEAQFPDCHKQLEENKGRIEDFSGSSATL